MPSHKQTLTYLALPFIAFVLLIVSNVTVATGTHFTLPVQGYDPRDLLYGHYMNLRIQQSFLDNLKDCACIQPQGGVFYTSCSQMPKTKDVCLVILDKKNDLLMKSLSERIQVYVDEIQAPMLQDVIQKNPDRLTVDATLNDGVVAVHGLMLDGKPVKMMASPNPFDKPVK